MYESLWYMAKISTLIYTLIKKINSKPLPPSRNFTEMEYLHKII